jgi:hypothetical protein
MTIVDSVAANTSISSRRHRGEGKKRSHMRKMRSRIHPTTVVSCAPSGIAEAAIQSGEEPYLRCETSQGSAEMTSTPWQRSYDARGLPGLRATRLPQYRTPVPSSPAAAPLIASSADLIPSSADLPPRSADFFPGSAALGICPTVC